MKLYNTLTKNEDELLPLNSPKVTVYSCGPTVYDFPHIGNWFTFIRYDLLIRSIKLLSFEPVWVINITDVGHLTSDADEGEDKLEKGAKREGKSAWEIAEFYTDYFLKGLKRLNISTPDHVPRATQHIPEQIALIQKLEKKNYTYTIDDGVYFDTSKFKDYSKFATLDVENQQSGARVAFNPQKRNSTDFALWKFSPNSTNRDMEWDSPWGRGFPGWHLECSAMILKYLGETIDIHAGGIEHIPVHNTNEITQSQCATGKPLAKLWFHSNHILIDGDKISKSSNNGITLEDLDKKNIPSIALRMLVLQSHYRTQSHFSWKILEDASLVLKSIQSDFSWIYSLPQELIGENLELDNFFSDYQTKIRLALADDLNTPRAIAYLHDAASKFSDFEIMPIDIQSVEKFSRFISDSLGLDILIKLTLTPKQKEMLDTRSAARNNKNWSESDALRDKLAEQRIGLRDTPNGTIWFPI